MRKWWWGLIILLWCPALRVQASEVGLNPASFQPFAVVLPPAHVVVPVPGRVFLPFVIRQWYGDALSPVSGIDVTTTQAGQVGTASKREDDGLSLDFSSGQMLPYQVTFSGSGLTATVTITAAPETGNPQLRALPPAVSQPFAMGVYQLDDALPGLVWSSPLSINGAKDPTRNYFMSLSQNSPSTTRWTIENQVVTVNQLPAVTARPGEWVTLTPNPHLPVVAGGTVTATATIDGQPVAGESAPNDGVRVPAPTTPGEHAYRIDLTYSKNNAQKTFKSGEGTLTVLPAAPLSQSLPAISAVTTQGLTVALPPTWWQGISTGTMTVALSPLTGPGGTLPTMLMGDGLPWLQAGDTKVLTATELANVASWTVVVPPVNTVLAGTYNGTITVTAISGP